MRPSSRLGFCRPIVLSLLFALSSSLAHADVALAGVIGSKALLVIDGGEPQTVRSGETVAGVKVISVADNQARVEINGKIRTLHIGQHASTATSSQQNSTGDQRLVLHADSQGHFLSTGQVNGHSLRFLVDTGATAIAIGSSDARRLGLNTKGGQQGISQTANGQIIISLVKLDTVRLGNITLHNVDAHVLPHDIPYALLGMSFLNRMEMQRSGQTMTLKKRF